jgi:hypothetical protein
MRTITRLLVLAGTLLIPAATIAKGKPQPPSCPPDLAAALTQACPCDGGAQGWKNHGKYVNCVVHFRNSLRKSHCLDSTSKRTLGSCAARSTCGKPGAVVCCPVHPGTCSDPTPDGVKAGVCANDPAVACDTDADCANRRGHVSRDEASCLAAGGVSDGPGSVCAAACSPSGAFLDAATL